MMNHEFYYSELSENPSYDYDYSLYYKKVADVSLHDNLIQYFGDSLAWVPSHNPSKKMEDQMGLNGYGVTTVKSGGAQKLHDILRAWSALFKVSPQRLKLTGEYGWTCGEDPEKGAYDKLEFDRDTLVGSLDLLADMCSKVAKSNDRAFLMHFGL
ncbi:MAG: hypothetical protein ABJ251_23860 [Paracoccaceae bacterium]